MNQLSDLHNVLFLICGLMLFFTTVGCLLLLLAVKTLRKHVLDTRDLLASAVETQYNMTLSFLKDMDRKNDDRLNEKYNNIYNFLQQINTESGMAFNEFRKRVYDNHHSNVADINDRHKELINAIDKITPKRNKAGQFQPKNTNHK